MNLKRVFLFAAMIALTASSVYGTFYPIVGDNELNLTYDSTGKLDLTNNSAIIQVTPLYSSIQNAISVGYNGGTWTGLEITSSVCANPLNNFIYALAPIAVTDFQTLESNVHAGFYGPTTYPGSLGVDDVSLLPSTATLIKFTYKGDANLDGSVESGDLIIVKNAIANGKIGSAPTDSWVHGDVNYDGSIESGDLIIVKNAIANQKITGTYTPIPLSAGGINPIPEPSTIVLLLLGFASLFTFKKNWK
jgi:hypothetical protein